MTPDPILAACRYGYGLPLPKGAPQDPDAMLASLSGPDSMATTFPGPRVDQALLALMTDTDTALKTSRRKQGSEASEARATYRAHVASLQSLRLSAAKTTFARALDAPDGFRERLVQFWASHFTTTARSNTQAPLPSALVEEAIRPHLTAPFSDMLRAAILHPAMLSYLDQSSSVGPNSAFGQRKKKGLNENLARELLELHTLGAGAGYTQADVRQMAELLTGVFLGKKGATFNPVRAEPGPETVLGQTYDGDTLAAIHRALDDLAQRPETAAHLARKLATHFVADNPDMALVDQISAAYRRTNGDLMATYTALLTHPAAWAPGKHKARQPFDFMVAALRALGLSGAQVLRMGDGPFRRMILNPMTPMGQPWQSAPGPDGWAEEAEAWITPQGMATRITWAMEVPGRLVRPLPNPTALMTRALGPNPAPALAWAVPRAESPRQAVGLILASPDFNRR